MCPILAFRLGPMPVELFATWLDRTRRIPTNRSLSFGGEFGFSIDALSWRRVDGAGAGASVYAADRDPNQLSLLGPEAVGADNDGQ